MQYRITIRWEDGHVVYHDRSEAADALKDADNAIPPGYRPNEFEAIGQDVHIFRTDTAVGDLERNGRMELTCPNGRIITIEKM